MNVKKIIDELNRKYPGKKIMKNGVPVTEIVCEIEKDKDKSIAIAVIEESAPHFHKKSVELYEVLSGKVDLFINGKKFGLKRGDKMTITPNNFHFAKGDEAWVKVTAKPGWTKDDHILFKK